LSFVVLVFPQYFHKVVLQSALDRKLRYRFFKSSSHIGILACHCHRKQIDRTAVLHKP